MAAQTGPGGGDSNVCQNGGKVGVGGKAHGKARADAAAGDDKLKRKGGSKKGEGGAAAGGGGGKKQVAGGTMFLCDDATLEAHNEYALQVRGLEGGGGGMWGWTGVGRGWGCPLSILCSLVCVWV